MDVCCFVNLLSSPFPQTHFLSHALSLYIFYLKNAVTQSVANTAKRVIVIVGVALVLGESLDFMKLLGCAIGKSLRGTHTHHFVYFFHLSFSLSWPLFLNCVCG